MKLDPNINKIHFETCIICKLNPPNSYEHLIPDSIGGIIEWKALCKSCNDKLGYTLIKDVKKDPRIRLAINHLKDILPRLFEKIENRQKYNSTDNKGNTIKYVYKDGKYRVLQTKIDESLIKGIEETEDYVKETLKKTGKNEEEIKIELAKFHEAEIDKPIQLANGIIIIKKDDDLYHNFDEAIVLSHGFLVLLAYEYISLFLGSFIFDDRLNYIREFILNQQVTDLIVVEEYSTSKYAPIHRIYCVNHEDKITINILLFGYIYYKINFIGFPYRFQESVILEDLEEKRAYAAESIEEAKKRNYKFEIKRMP